MKPRLKFLGKQLRMNAFYLRAWACFPPCNACSWASYATEEHTFWTKHFFTCHRIGDMCKCEGAHYDIFLVHYEFR
jgi:hypothetical protein